MNTKKEEQRLHLKALAERTDYRVYNNKRRWGHPEGRTVSVAHINGTQRRITIDASVELQRRIERFLKLYPEYVPSVTVSTIGANLITATGFYIKGYLGELPLSNYLLYLTYQDWTYQKKFRDSPKRKNIMYNQMVSLGIIQLCFEEALRKIVNKGVILTTHYDKPNKEYTDIEDAYTTATLGFDSYSFDR